MFLLKAEYLISWVGYDSDENSWQPKKNLRCPAKLAEFEASIKNNKNNTRTGKNLENKTSFTSKKNEVLRKLSKCII